jgi:hypothetical protein
VIGSSDTPVWGCLPSGVTLDAFNVAERAFTAVLLLVCAAARSQQHRLA